MHFRSNPVIRIISIIVLAFFTWSFGGVFEVAYAVKESSQPSTVSPQWKNNSSQPLATNSQTETKKDRAEEKFGKAIEDIENILKDDKADHETKKQRIRSKKAEIDVNDIEIRKQFSETEGKIKDLPEVIKKRHGDFVKHYDDNFRELKANLDDIDKAKDNTEVEAKIKRAKAHLEKVKPPKKHKALDPNKLPHRTPEAEHREPRTKPEEFEKEKDQVARGKNQGKPILVAANGSLDGLLSSNTQYNAKTNDLLPDGSFQLALANPPTAADLAETIEVQFTPAITAKAAELGNSPVKIYEYVKNNFEYEPYYGSLKGAEQTLLEKAGNDFDQASLLIALLRAANIPSRYVYGTIEIPIDKLMNWVGGITDQNTATQILATAGVPGKLLTEGGQIKYIQFEHCWVEVYVPYGNYRGIPGDESIKTWIPLDPSYKQYKYKRGMDLYAAMRINGEQYIMDYITDTSPSPIPTELQELFPDYAISPYQYYSKRLLDHIDANLPNVAMEDILGAESIDQTKIIIKKEYPYLLGSLPYEVKVRGSNFSAISNTFRHKISFSVRDETVFGSDLIFTKTLPELAGKRLTVSYIPANPTDEALVGRYGGLLNVPPYLISVKPVIKVDGNTVAFGSAVGLGAEQIFDIAFNLPNKKVDIVTNKIMAGDYSAVAIQYYKTPADVVGTQMQKLQGNVTSTDLDNLLGQMLHNIGMSYLHHLGFEEELYAKNFQMVITKEPSAAIVTSQAKSEVLWGVPYKIAEGGVAVDVDRNIYVPFSIDGNQQRKKDFMVVAGIGSSSWENKVLESFLNVPSVSSARLLKLASQRGIPIFTIDNTNFNAVLPQLQVTAETINDIQNSINAGKKIIVPKTSLQYNDWYGDGYIVLDPVKGSSAYLISGGLAGAEESKSKNPDASIRAKSDWLAFMTSLTRRYILDLAIALLGTLYVRGGESEMCGFDCSGLIHYIFTSTYGPRVFYRAGKGGCRGAERLTAACQHANLEAGNMTLPYSERLPGDILWVKDYSHTGIYFGQGTGAYNGADVVIHASGRSCKQGEVPSLPSESLPPECSSSAEIGVPICGYYRMVVITLVNPYFAKSSNLASDIGRPVP
ncbi:MAG: C40 family peptidase [Nitrospirae bacterium]|nr:C40 family peptidase [Nitrospirota bacterium]